MKFCYVYCRGQMWDLSTALELANKSESKFIACYYELCIDAIGALYYCRTIPGTELTTHQN